MFSGPNRLYRMQKSWGKKKRTDVEIIGREEKIPQAPGGCNGRWDFKGRGRGFSLWPGYGGNNFRILASVSLSENLRALERQLGFPAQV